MKLKRRPPYELTVVWDDYGKPQTFRLKRGDTLKIDNPESDKHLLKVEYLESGQLHITPLALFAHVTSPDLRKLADYLDALRETTR